MTVLEKEYMTRMPNEIRELRKSIKNLTEVLKQIIAGRYEVRVDLGLDPDRSTENINTLVNDEEGQSSKG